MATRGNWNAYRNSIGVCLIGDFSRRPPAPGQFTELVELVRRLQAACGDRPLPASTVYLHRQIDPRTDSPGPAFPAQAFESYLIGS